MDIYVQTPDTNEYLITEARTLHSIGCKYDYYMHN